MDNLEGAPQNQRKSLINYPDVKSNNANNQYYSNYNVSHSKREVHEISDLILKKKTSKDPNVILLKLIQIITMIIDLA